jgi:excisionase family DNA binding protein
MDTVMNAAPSGRRFLTAAEVAEMMGVESETVRRWARANRIPHIKFGPARTAPLRFDATEIDRWLLTKVVA